MNAKNFRNRGFTLVELMITMVMLSLIVVAIVSVVVNSQKAKRNTELMSEAQQTGRILVDMLSEDIRSAGYGANAPAGHMPIVYAGPFDIMISANLTPLTDDPTNHGSPQAIKPGVAPLPGDSTGTNPLYDGGIGFTDGAETIRYAFDSDNNGTVTEADRGDDLEETLTRNVDLYSLTRQIYGYNTTTDDNTGTNLPVGMALSNFPVRSAGSQVPPMFQYWILDNTTGLDKLWGDTDGSGTLSPDEVDALYAGTDGGVVPFANLRYVTKVGIAVTTATKSPNSKNTYEELTINTITTITRNREVKAGKVISGRVGVDADNSHTLADGEAGIQNIKVTNETDGQVTFTEADGSFLFNVEPKKHVISIALPIVVCGATIGYKVVPPIKTDTMVNATSADQVVNFPLTAFTPVSVTGIVYNDATNYGTIDAGELGIGGCIIASRNTGSSTVSNADGTYCLAIEPGTHYIYCVPIEMNPELIPTTPDSGVTISLLTGSTTQNFGFKNAGMAHIRGRVFKDVTAPVGSYNLTEYGDSYGIGGVTILVMQGADPVTEELEYQTTTDSKGYFAVDVAETDAANPYSIIEVDSAGWLSTMPNRLLIYKPGSPTDRSLAPGDTAGKLILEPNRYVFGDIKMDTVRIPAAQVLSMTVKNFFEWQSSTATNDTATAKRDPDIVLGTRYVNTTVGNIRGWFSKRYKIDNSSETDIRYLFDASATNYMYERIPNSSGDIIALTCDTLDDRANKGYTGLNGNLQFARSRPDLVLGLDNKTTGLAYNVVVWPTLNNDTTTNSSKGRAEWSNNIPSTPNYKLIAVSADNLVNTVVTGNFGGDGFPDIVAGYSNFGATNTGGFVLWINQPYTSYTGSWTNKQVRYFGTQVPPTTQQFTGLGAVKALAADTLVGGDAMKDLVVGLRTADYQGEIQIYKGKGVAPWCSLATTLTYDGVQGEVKGLKVIDINNDKRLDIVAIVKTELYDGELQVWLNNSDGTFGKLLSGNRIPSFVAVLGGEPLAVEASRMNWVSGSLFPHIIVGLKTLSIVPGTALGKTLVYDCYGGVLPTEGTDPSGGMFTGEVATIGLGDFNLDGHIDIAVAERKSASEGNLILYYPKF